MSTAMPDPVALLAAYDRHRPWSQFEAAAGLTIERFGALIRVTGRGRGAIETEADIGLTGDALDAVILQHRDHFSARGESAEWKTYAHDRPSDLTDHLIEAGFRADEPETVMIGPADRMVDVGAPPPGVALRPTRDRDDLVAVAALDTAVWDEDWMWLADELQRDLAARGDAMTLFVAEAAGRIVSAAWVVVTPGTGFAGLWGGSTLAEFRHRGIYRALVAARARVAAEQGGTYLQVDASDDSRPILERLGFVAVTTTTPYVWTPR